MASVEPRWQTRLLGQFQEGAHENKYTGGMLKQRERVRGSLQRIPPDMSVSLRDGRAFVSDERHDNGVRNASILEQADSGVPQRVKTQFEYLAFAYTSYATRGVRPWLAESGGSEKLGELSGKHPHTSVLRMNDFVVPRMDG